MKNPEKIILSRTDSIGDSVLTLPMCGKIKAAFPGVKLCYFGKSYVKDVVMRSDHVDDFLVYEEGMSINHITSLFKTVGADTIIHVFPRKEIARAARVAGVKHRIGTTGRLYHWTNCNHKVRFSRKKSDLHEAQLNCKLLKPFGISAELDLNAVPSLYGVSKPKATKSNRVILHPGSRGSAVDWPLVHFVALAELLIDKGYEVHLSGTEDEGVSFRAAFKFSENLIDQSGRMSLNELIDFIGGAEALVACSTGPLHIAAMLGVKAIGLFVDIRPIHPGRWAPLGEKAIVLTPEVSESRQSIETISPEQVLEELVRH